MEGSDGSVRLLGFTCRTTIRALDDLKTWPNNDHPTTLGNGAPFHSQNGQRTTPSGVRREGHASITTRLLASRSL